MNPLGKTSPILTSQAGAQIAILDTILASGDLPTLPSVAAKLLTLMGQENTSLAEIASLVAQDAALAINIIRVANSSFYSFPNKICTVQQAVALLGSNAVRSLVLTFSLLLLKVEKKSRFDHTRFWERSLAGAAGASVVGLILLGPIGLVGGVFVHGKNLTVPAGALLYIQTQNDVELVGMVAK